MNNKNIMKKSPADRIFLAAVYLCLALFVLVVIYPLVYVVSCSFSSPQDLVAGRVVLWPVNPGLQGYKAVLGDERVWSGYGNTILYTVLGTLIGTSVTFIGAFVLSRKEFPLRGALTTVFAITMFFGGGTIPTHLLLKQLHMLNTVWSIVLPGAFNVWLAVVGRTFIQSSIPEELFEATSLDGGDYMQYLTKVVLPLAKPILAVLALNFALSHWNSYYSALLYLNESDKFPLQLVLRNILLNNQVDITQMNTDALDMMNKQYLSELLKYSLIIISSVPLMVTYPFLQKYFIKGAMVGSVKG